MRVATYLLLAPLLLSCASTGNRATVTPSSAVRAGLLAQGYRPADYQGQVLYCRDEMVTGTQFAGRVCLSEAQIRRQEEDIRELARSRALNPNLRCQNQDCSK